MNTTMKLVFFILICALIPGCATPYLKVAKNSGDLGWFVRKNNKGEFKIEGKAKYMDFGFVAWTVDTFPKIQRIRLETYLRACEEVKKAGFDSFEVVEEKVDESSMSGGELALRCITVIGIFLPDYNTANVSLRVRGLPGRGRKWPAGWKVVDITEFIWKYPHVENWPVTVDEPISFPPSGWVEWKEEGLPKDDSSFVAVYRDSIHLEQVDDQIINTKGSPTWLKIPSGRHSFLVSYSQGNLISQNNLEHVYDLQPGTVYRLMGEISDDRNTWNFDLKKVDVEDPTFNEEDVDVEQFKKTLSKDNEINRFLLTRIPKEPGPYSAEITARGIVDTLNSLMRDPFLYSKIDVKGEQLLDETRKLYARANKMAPIGEKLSQHELEILNRGLLQSIFPTGIINRRIFRN